MGGPRHPEDAWFRPAAAATTVIALVIALLTWRNATHSRSFSSLGETAKEQIAALEIEPTVIATVEQEWVADGFDAAYLMAPVGPQPCREGVATASPFDQFALREAFAALENEESDRIDALASVFDGHPSNLLIALMLTTELVRAERFTEAETIAKTAFDRTGADEAVIVAAKRPGTRLDLDDADVSTVIHLHHALGVARLSQSGAEPPWKSLKNVIGSVKQLSRRRLLGTAKGQAVASKLLIAAPGCARGSESLSSYDLFNNLIVGYARGKYSDIPQNRAREFFRESKTYPSAVRQLLLAAHGLESTNGWNNEAQLWALSNAEQVLDWRRPDDARLNFNIIQLIDWWTAPDHCPAEVCTAELLRDLRHEKDLLLERAIRRRNVTAEQQPVFAMGVARMLARSALDRSKIESDVQALREWLKPQKAAVLDDLLASGQARAALPAWMVSAEGDAPYTKLGRRGDRWRDAAMTDFADAVARWAMTRPPAEKRQVLVAIRQTLGASKAPPAVVALENSFSTWQRLLARLSASKIAWAVFAIALAALLWIVAIWILKQVREWRSLRRSFYNVELDHLRKEGPEGDPR